MVFVPLPPPSPKKRVEGRTPLTRQRRNQNNKLSTPQHTAKAHPISFFHTVRPASPRTGLSIQFTQSMPRALTAARNFSALREQQAWKVAMGPPITPAPPAHELQSFVADVLTSPGVVRAPRPAGVHPDETSTADAADDNDNALPSAAHLSSAPLATSPSTSTSASPGLQRRHAGASPASSSLGALAHLAPSASPAAQRSPGSAEVASSSARCAPGAAALAAAPTQAAEAALGDSIALDLLSQVPLFAQLSRAQLFVLISRVERRYLPRYSAVLREGTHGHGLLVLLAGRVRVTSLADNVDATLGPGALLGEAWLLGEAQPADVSTLDACLVLKLTDADLSSMHFNFEALGIAGTSDISLPTTVEAELVPNEASQRKLPHEQPQQQQHRHHHPDEAPGSFDPFAQLEEAGVIGGATRPERVARRSDSARAARLPPRLHTPQLPPLLNSRHYRARPETSHWGVHASGAVSAREALATRAREALATRASTRASTARSTEFGGPGWTEPIGLGSRAMDLQDATSSGMRATTAHRQGPIWSKQDKGRILAARRVLRPATTTMLNYYPAPATIASVALDTPSVHSVLDAIYQASAHRAVDVAPIAAAHPVIDPPPARPKSTIGERALMLPRRKGRPGLETEARELRWTAVGER